MGKLLRRIRYWFNRRRADSNLAEEIEFHRSLRQKSLERSGLSQADAASASRKELGNPLLAREASRDVWGWTSLKNALRDIRYAFRAIGRSPMANRDRSRGSFKQRFGS